MIRLRADITTTVVVNPTNWDSVGALEVALQNAVTRALGGLGQVPIFDITVTTLGELDAETLGVT